MLLFRLSSQSYGFSSNHVWMWELNYKEKWVLRIDAFELWCWRRLSRVPWSARRSNQSILKEINPEYSFWKGWCWCWNSQYFGPPDAKSWLIEKDPDAGKDWGQEKGTTEDEMVGWHHQLNGHELSKLRQIVEDIEAQCAAVQGDSGRGGLSDWASWCQDWSATLWP